MRNDAQDKIIAVILENYEKNLEKARERLTWLEEEEKNNSDSAYGDWVADEICIQKRQIDEINLIWGAYLNLPLEEKEALQGLYVKGLNYRDFSKNTQKSMSQIKRLRRKGLNDIRAALGRSIKDRCDAD